MHRYRHTPTTLLELARIAQLDGASPDQFATLTPHADLITVAPGTVLEHAGSFARQLLHVVRGNVLALDVDGSRRMLGDGSTIGADQLLGGAAHRATYTAATSTDLLVVFGPPIRRVMHALGVVPSRLAGPLFTIDRSPAAPLGIAS